MIALKLTNVKACMSHLLLMDTFDSFLLIEGEIMTFNTFKIDGFIQKNFYTSEELEQMGTLPEYAYWKQLREYCFSLIKGKKTPLGFRFVFSLSPKNIARLIEQNELGLNADDIQGLYLNLRYDSTGLQCITIFQILLHGQVAGTRLGQHGTEVFPEKRTGFRNFVICNFSSTNTII